MDRAEAEAIYDSGREACVQFILDLAARVREFEERLNRLEAQARQDSLTSSKPPSSDPPKTRAQRRAGGRAETKGVVRSEGGGGQAGGAAWATGGGRAARARGANCWVRRSFPGCCGWGGRSVP